LVHQTTITLSEFAWSALTDEAERQAIPIEELLVHAAMYYLADLDSGRPAARVLRHEQDADGDDVGDQTPRRFERPASD
jgi:hypothetical protein